MTPGFPRASSRERRRLTSVATLQGDMLTLGNGASIRGLSVEDLPTRLGNNIVIGSRAPGDRVSADVHECEMIVTGPSGAGFDGPVRRGLLVWTRNLLSGGNPPPEVDSTISVRLTSSIIRSPGRGSGVFAINFASGGKVSVHMSGNVIGGGLDAHGGVSREDSVQGSSTEIFSHRNLYRSDAAGTALGMQITGASGNPSGAAVPASISNSLSLHSIDDRIEGFVTGILAVGGRRYAAAAGPVNGNTLDLKLEGTQITATNWALRLFGAKTEAGSASVAAGDDNILNALLRGVTTTSPLPNQFADTGAPGTAGPGDPALAGIGNSLEFIGNRNAFEQTNELPPLDLR